MKLAIVTAYPPSKVTLNEYAYHLVKSFRQNKKVTELILLTDITPAGKDIHFTEDGCKITIKECWKFNSYTNVIKVTKAISTIKPDAVLFNLQFMKFGDKKVAAALGLMLPLVCKIKKIPTIVLLHNILEQTDLESAGFTSNKIVQKVYNFIGETLTKLILKADIVAVTMDKYVTTLQDKYKVNNVKMIPHGTFEIPNKPSHILPKGALKIMTFGKFGTYKKVEKMIEAVQKVRVSTGLNLEIVIAGTDNPNVPGYLASVKEKYKNVAQITFTGYVEEVEVAPLFNESAVVVFPYTSTTGSSGVLHQAGSYGKAVVMPNLGDLATLIEDEGYRGEFFEPESVASLANAIELIVTNETHRIALGEANYKAATAFPMQRITAMYLNQFEAIIMVKKLAKKVLIES
ncbi:glycosyltransferase [Tenacibaculum finnmarkense genomovar finnmarkense]|uniref:glycosyltransferase n=1 Tax=Tenacibaculum finnmarkense TaxID=2781243 RepID=UPI001E60390B|nr:glycosyltransferase [Tenacibaculum finnmarkense]MCD8416954.1 glycosyltransferase [Tenacibaculum finnmarkense genomovar finnmarkense]MCG8185407.1 glycosyltransferase [Tenacibaculum finnmarkense genomovar finnmarkense]MCG8209460.1 glycosyltransferase [Tenacibaculum finnmarkense genomovar finnmarkense]MCG8212256.1 glycosyltransferase [Tenacibaculum finnmarkense genomovar finnmarkense]MCG8219468.1 glycosyltransferase [Tenacibaculum finnmarkense genomovar finnmarkense]